MYKRVRPLTHSLTQCNSDDSMEDCITNFDEQIDLEALRPIKTRFWEISPLPPPGGICLKHVSEHNLTLYYLTMKKLPTGWLNLNTKKMISHILEFSILRARKGKIIEFRKIRIFERNSALNYSMVKKFHMMGLHVSTKIIIFGDFSIFDFNGEKSLNFGKSGFLRVIWT